jgi:hypothetical protein
VIGVPPTGSLARAGGTRAHRDPSGARVRGEREGMPGGVRCATCGHEVTTREQLIAVDGASEHERDNPHGYRFRFRCYAHAPGCQALGDQTAMWSWFAGYRWQLAYCRGCSAHLGWAFVSAMNRFFGLIVDRLIDDQS